MQVAPPVVSGVSQGQHLGQIVLGPLGLGPLPINLYTTIILHPTLHIQGPTPQALTIPPMTTYLKVSN